MHPDDVFARLTELGWFKHVHESELDEVRARFESEYAAAPTILAPEEEVTAPDGQFLGTRGIDRRSCFADPENLAEGDVSKVFLLLADAFANEGVRFHTIEDDTDEGYALVIDGVRHVLFGTPGYGWDDVVRRTLDLANELLAKAGSRERLYDFVTLGNDGWMILLSPEQLAYVRTLPISPKLNLAE